MDYGNSRVLNSPVSSYFTVSNSASHNIFPDNLSNSFSNHLPIPILPNGSGLEVALTDCYFTPSASTHKSTIFGHESGDNIIKLTKRAESDHCVDIIGDTINDFVEHINNEFKKRGVRLFINRVITAENLDFWQLNLIQPGYKVSITPPEFGEALGFTKQEYESGKSIAERESSPELFKLIARSDKIKFTIFKDTDFNLKVEEPNIKTVVGLITSINNALSGYNVFVSWDGESFIFEDESIGITLVKFSELIEIIFGIPHNSVFQGGEVKFPSYSTIDLGISANLNVVTCSIVEPQYYRGRPLPVLKIFPYQASPTQVHVKCNPLQYISMPDYRFDNIKVELFDEHLNPLLLKPESETTLVLHIKNQF